MNNVQIWKSVCKASCWHKHCQCFVFACSSCLLTLLDSLAINLHEKCLTFRSRFWKLLNYNPIVYCLLRRTISSKYPVSLFFLVGFLPTFSLRFIVKDQAEHKNGTLTWQSGYQVINVQWNLTETFGSNCLLGMFFMGNTAHISMMSWCWHTHVFISLWFLKCFYLFIYLFCPT